MARLIAIAYLMWCGYMIAKTDLDKKALEWAHRQFTELVREAAAIAREEQPPPPALEAGP
jgi:hypothetical protein